MHIIRSRYSFCLTFVSWRCCCPPISHSLTHNNTQDKIIFGYQCGMPGNLAAVLLIRLKLFCISSICLNFSRRWCNLDTKTKKMRSPLCLNIMPKCKPLLFDIKYTRPDQQRGLGHNSSLQLRVCHLGPYLGASIPSPFLSRPLFRGTLFRSGSREMDLSENPAMF